MEGWVRRTREEEEEEEGSWKAVAWGQMEQHSMAAISMAAVEARRGRARLRIGCGVFCIIEGMLVVVEWQESGTRAKGAGRAAAGAGSKRRCCDERSRRLDQALARTAVGSVASPVGVVVVHDWTRMMMRSKRHMRNG